MPSFWHRLFRLLARFLIGALEALFPGPPIGAVIIFSRKGEVQMGEIIVKDDETTLRSSLTLLDAEGHPTTPEGTPTYESSDESVAVVTPSEDGLTATYEVGAPGDAVITVTGLGTNNAGDEIVGKGTIHVTAGDVETVSVEFEVG